MIYRGRYHSQAKAIKIRAKAKAKSRTRRREHAKANLKAARARGLIIRTSPEADGKHSNRTSHYKYHFTNMSEMSKEYPDLWQKLESICSSSTITDGDYEPRRPNKEFTRSGDGAYANNTTQPIHIHEPARREY